MSINNQNSEPDNDKQNYPGEKPLVNTKQVIEEHLHIDKEVVETGKIHISKKVLEEDYSADIPVFKEEVMVERKPVNKYVDGELPGIRLDGDTTIIPVIKEVVIKRILLVEELHITKRISESTVPVREKLRREEVTVERNDNQNSKEELNQ